MLVKKVLNRILWNYPSCRDIEVWSDDVFLVSYPRSGNTWMRFMLGKLIYNIDIDFVNKEDVIPDLYKNSNKELKEIARPRIIKSHEAFDSRYKKVIYICRDVRDVVLSYHKWFMKYKGYDKGLDEFMTKFIEGSLDNYGGWDSHVIGWIESFENKDNILILHYKDIKNDTPNELKKILAFLSIDRSDQEIKKAILSANINQMSKLEKEQENESIELKGSRRDISFIKGSEGRTWENTLNASQKNRMNEAFKETLDRVGY